MRRSRPGPPTWWAALAGLALPAACPGCGAPGIRICPSCLASLHARPFVVAPPLAPEDVPVLAAAPYQGPLREAIVAWKDHGRLDLTPVLGAMLADVVAARLEEVRASVGAPPGWCGGGVALVPAPSSAAASRRRGEDVVASLAAHARAGLSQRPGVRPTALPHVATVLRQRRGVADQAGLDRRARSANLRGRLTLRGCPPIAALLVDDIVTTGATASAAVACLRGAGVAVLGVCAVSATPARRPLSDGRELG